MIRSTGSRKNRTFTGDPSDVQYSCAFISLYPKRGEIYSAGTTGVASYAKNTALRMGGHVLVLADYDLKPEHYSEENTSVYRCFKPNTFSMWFNIYNHLRLFPKIKDIFIQFDTAMYGNMFVSGLIIPFLALLKYKGYHVNVVNHHVIADVSRLKGHIGLTNRLSDTYRAHIYNGLFHIFYRLLGLTAQSIIVLENPLKKRLSPYVNDQKILVIPHAVDDTLEPISKARARKRLKIASHEYVVMFFGFVNWFKGADIFAKTFRDIQHLAGRKVHFLIAGGQSATLKDKEFYQAYFENVLRYVKRSKNMKITGYVPQKNIRDYFAAADLIVFPYRDFMCASGVLSLTFTFKKPFILSHELGSMLSSPDFKEALENAGIEKSDMTFSLTEKSMISTAENVLKNGLKRKLSYVSLQMKEKRAFYQNARFYNELISKRKASQAALFQMRYT